MQQVKTIARRALAGSVTTKREQDAEQVFRQALTTVKSGKCPVCKGKEWLYQYPDAAPGTPEFSAIARCPYCAPAERKRYYMGHCGLEKAEQAHDLSNWFLGSWSGFSVEQAAIYRAQRQAAKDEMRAAVNRGTGLLTFWGDYGTGKSRALAAIVNESIELGREAIYTTMEGLLAHLRGLVARNQDSSSYWERMLGSRVLCVDEIDRFHETSWTRAQVFILTDTRYRMRDHALTVFATNTDPNDPSHGDEDVGYLYSRMREGRLIELRGDMRPAASGLYD